MTDDWRVASIFELCKFDYSVSLSFFNYSHLLDIVGSGSTLATISTAAV